MHENHEKEMRKLQVLLDKTKKDAEARIKSIQLDEVKMKEFKHKITTKKIKLESSSYER